MRRRVRLLNLMILLGMPVVVAPSFIAMGELGGIAAFVFVSLFLLVGQTILLRCPECGGNVLKTKRGYYLWYNGKCRRCGHNFRD